MNIVTLIRAIVLLPGTVLVGGFVCARLAARQALQHDPTNAATKLRERTFGIGLVTAFATVLVGVPAGLLKLLASLTKQIPVLGASPVQPALYYVSVVFGPALAGYLVVSLAMLPAWRQLKGVETTVRTRIRETVVRYGAAVGPKLGLFLLATTLSPGLPVVLGTAFAFAVYTAVTPMINEALNETRSLNSKEYEQLGAIADRDVPVRVVIASDAKQAQGFAVGVVPGTQRVYLTDYLLNELTDNQVRAIAEHEFAHLRQGHVLLRRTLWGILTVGTAVAIADSSVRGLLIAAAVGLAYWLLVAGVARWTEYEADRIAADAESETAMSDALDALADRNLLPREQTRLDAWLSEYPSLQRRKARLAE